MATNYKPLSEEELEAMKRAAATAKFLSIPADIVGKGVNALWELPGIVKTGKGRNQRQSDRLAREAGPQGIGGTPQTRDHSWFDGGNAYASQPGTGQFIRLPEDMQVTTSQDRGNIATAKAAQDTDIANQKSIGATNARASWLKATADSPAAKAGFSDDERWNLQQQHREWKANRSGTTPSESTSQQLQGTPNNNTFSTTATNIPQLPNLTKNGLGLNIDYNTPPKGWDAGAAFNMTPNELGALGANAGGNAMAGAAQGMAAAAAKAIISEIFAPKKGDAGANTSQGALSGGNAWEKFYTGDEFTSLPAWYM